MQHSLDLLKLIGGIVALKHLPFGELTFIQQIDSIAVNQVKTFRSRFLVGKEKIENLTYEVGRGKG